MKQLLCVTCVFLCLSWGQAQPLNSPEAFLGYPLGSAFTYHHRVVDYARQLAEQSPRVQAIPYGETYEGRPLMLLALTSEQNMAQLEAIRLRNLARTGLRPELEAPSGPDLPIVWLSYNIHGNEAVSTEAAMQTAYTLATADTAGWLDSLVVLIDPCLNPDGRDRYVNWYRQARHFPNNVHPDAWEHHEPWPGGRFNHYLFDLNRDWCWQTQQESRLRADIYREWMPQVHIDLHEMGPSAPYFFAPSAKPIHEAVTDWQREFQRLTGENHARYFDANHWLYFTKETFDLLYPSYGDTWPTFQGAIGATYEQGGSGRAGLAYLQATGDTLTLGDRIAHHYLASLSTVEAAFHQREKLIEAFGQYFSQAQTLGSGAWQSILIKGNRYPGRLRSLLDLLDRNQIRYYQAGALGGQRVQANSYQDRQPTFVSVGPSDVVIPVVQPQGNLVRVLFEPEPLLEDSLTYDLTAWALPYAYGLEAYYSERLLSHAPEPGLPEPAPAARAERLPYAYAVTWGDPAAASWLAAMLEAGFRARYAEDSFMAEGHEFGRGTLLFVRTDHPQPEFDARLQALAREKGIRPVPLFSGMVQRGADLGARGVKPLPAPRVGLVNGDEVSPLAFGELWHWFERDLGYPVTVLNTAYLGQVELSGYHVLILPSGSYERFKPQLLAYVRAGGKLILLENALELVSRFGEDSSLPPTALARALKQAKGAQENKQPAQADSSWLRYEARERDRASSRVEGAIYAVSLDDSHPLAFGEDSLTYFIKRNRTPYPVLPPGSWTPGRFLSGSPVAGFAGARLQQQLGGTLAIGTERYGEGTLVYFVDSPIFRGFWESGKLLLANAVFFD